MYALNDNVTYFGSFGVKNVAKTNQKFSRNKNIKTNVFGIQAYDSAMCEYFCLGFIDFRLKGKRLTDFTNPLHQIILKTMMI